MMIDQKQRFTEIYNKNLFNGKESRSGEGSSLEQTAILRSELPKIFLKFNIESILDAPCGDWNWMKKLNLTNIKYIGVDIVDEVILSNSKYIKSNINFMVKDIIKDDLPKVDLIFCRDCLAHLKYDDIFSVLRNFKVSGAKYILTTTYPNLENSNTELSGIWRALNLERSPFNFSCPLDHIIEMDFKPPINIKTLALWKLEDIDI